MSKGSLLSLSSNWALDHVPTPIDWDAETVLGGSSRWAATPNPERITIGADLDGEIVEALAFIQTASSAAFPIIEVRHNGTALGRSSHRNHYLPFHSVRSGLVQVATNDYFEVYAWYEVVGGSSWSVDKDESGFGVVQTDRLGFVEASIPTDITGQSFAPLVLTTTIDTLDTFVEPDGFLVPAGATAAIVSLNCYDANGPRGGGSFRVLLNSGIERQKSTYTLAATSYNPGAPDFGIIPVTAGQTLEVSYGGVGIDAADFTLGIEWISSQ